MLAVELLTCADEALYAAKAVGRNQYYLFDDRLRDRLEMRRDVERDLQRAISESALEVWYQPIFAENETRLVSFEALLRWKHPRHGLVPPQELILIAAMAGLAEPLLRYIFDQVCLLIRALSTRGLTHIRVAMNISPREISRVAIDEILLVGLEHVDCPASMLEIEITEETVLDIRSVQDKLHRLSDGGVHITVDDFGVGYGTLEMLLQPHISKIKLDQSLIRNICHSHAHQILVESMLNLGRSLGMQVVAEGVETGEDRAILRKLGCDLMQGYYFQRPAPLRETIEWLQSQEI
jgi:diguanylate cyclase